MSFWGNRKPPFGTRIDRGHPLAAGIAGCWLFNHSSGHFNAADNHRDAFASGSTWRSDGVLQLRTGNGPNFTVRGGGAVIPNTAFWLGNVITSASTDLFFTASGTTGDTIIRVDKTNMRMQYNMGRQAYANTSYYSASSSVAYDTDFTWAFANGHYQGAFFDGALVGSMGAVNVQIADTVRLGGAGWESNSSAMLKTFMFWLRCLSVDEIAWLHAEPYAMFEPPNLEVFYSIPSGVPTFNPAWAMNSNQVLYV